MRAAVEIMRRRWAAYFSGLVGPASEPRVLAGQGGGINIAGKTVRRGDLTGRTIVLPKPEPILMLLWCPECGERHIDEGAFATKEHHTHACQHCGHCWRPAVVPTTGVRFLPGFKNEATT